MFSDHKKSFLGRGWAFPPTFGENGRLGMVELEADIRESIFILLSTLPGERILNPKYGCDLHSQVFREITSNTIAQIQGMVASAIIKFEPRVDLEQVQIDESREADGILDIHIEYTVRSINTRTNMVYPFYLKEGTDLPEY